MLSNRTVGFDSNEEFRLFLSASGPTILSTTAATNGSSGSTVTAAGLSAVSSSLSQTVYPGILPTNYTARVPLHVKYVEAETSSRLCGVEVRRGEVLAQVSSSSLDHGSKLRGPLPKAEECDINIHSLGLNYK
ncbi:hypothetical protein TNCV_2840951 [Trichonephila clavipes]|uniref:Uncharacterized protein n=1 Tax=Trichonephila clavipes TaxID=2585209 RepID=A0A8X6RN51_TRICX|nr:hypothetical protein TNCV_2840951 [Trichonephila clavipes]